MGSMYPLWWWQAVSLDHTRLGGACGERPAGRRAGRAGRLSWSGGVQPEVWRSGRHYTHHVSHCSSLSGSAHARYPLGVLRGQNAAANLPAVLTVLPALPHALVQYPLAVAKHQAPGAACVSAPGRHPRLSALAPRALSAAPAPGPPDGTCQAGCRSMCKAAPHACPVMKPAACI